MPIVGLDIGGANLKGATADGQALSVPFALWKRPAELADALQTLLAGWPTIDGLAVTMTGELADCFETKSDGVRHIVAVCQEVAAGKPLAFWSTQGRFVSAGAAHEAPRSVAAANWHALATFGGRFASRGSGLLIDIGSTTTDIIPLCDGQPRSAGHTDPERLLSGKLVYTGVRRTPLCALSPEVPFRGQKCLVAAELFATTLDVYLLRGDIAQEPANCETADGRPATRDHAHARIARMVCADVEECSLTEACAMAEFFAHSQQNQIQTAVERVWESQKAKCEFVILSGEGSFLAHQILERGLFPGEMHVLRLADRLSPEISTAACAYAVATLFAESQEFVSR